MKSHIYAWAWLKHDIIYAVIICAINEACSFEKF